MAAPTVSVLDELRKLGIEFDPGFLRQAVALMMRVLMDAEVQALIGAERYQRTDERTTQRNGYRERNWQTRRCRAPDPETPQRLILSLVSRAASPR